MADSENSSVLSGTNIISVGSGKGGVGKSTITANLAFSLQKLGNKVGVLDADVYGFNIPKLMGVEGQRALGKDDNTISPLEREGIKIISVGSFMDDVDKAVIWRGPAASGIIKKFIDDVDWGELDYLLVDLPPGTGDVPLSIMQMLKDSSLLIVTTPQSSASHIAGRVGFLANEVDVSVLGIIENMSHFSCPNCGETYEIFGKGETEVLAEKLETPILGQVPLITEIREKSDSGNPVTLEHGKGEKELTQIAEKIQNIYKDN